MKRAIIVLFVLLFGWSAFSGQSQEACKKCLNASCKKLQTCSEVMFCFKECGIMRLDADNDGIPCECDACKTLNPNPNRCEIYRMEERR